MEDIKQSIKDLNDKSKEAKHDLVGLLEISSEDME